MSRLKAEKKRLRKYNEELDKMIEEVETFEELSERWTKFLDNLYQDLFTQRLTKKQK